MLYFFVFRALSWVDGFGVVYDSSTQERLEFVPASVTNYVIPANTTSIAGGTKYTSAFYECTNHKLSLSFSNGSLLTSIEPYGLAFLDTETLDMSQCIHLTILGQGSLYGNKVKSIILPPNLKEIKAGALCGMPNIEVLEFPASLESTEGYASWDFPSSCGYNPKLTTAIFPIDSNLTSLGSLTFARTNLQVLSIPASLTSIDAQIIIHCPVTRIEVANGSKTYSTDSIFLMNLEKTAIYLCPSRIPGNLTIPSTITSIKYGAFAGSIAETVILHDKIVSLSRDSFVHSSLRYISLPSSIKTIGSRTFYNCSITNIDFQASISYIPSEMFLMCENLKEIIIPVTVTTISHSAFAQCSSIQHIFIPKSVTTIKEKAFADINKTAWIEFDNESQLHLSDDIVYSADKKSLILYIGSNSKLELVVPNSVEIIIGGAFNGVSFSSIVFESVSKLTTIESLAFASSSISSITFPNSLLQIGDNAFSYSNLSNVNFNSGLLKIGVNSFQKTLITEAILPSSLQEIGLGAFAWSLLAKITFDGESNITSIGKSAFANTNISSIKIPSSIKTIGASLFTNSPLKLLSFESPSKLKEIPPMAFMDLKDLLGVSFASGIETIGQSAFENCVSLNTIDIAKDIQRIEMYAFRYCTSLTRVNIPDDTLLNASGFGMFAFNGCTSLVEFSVTLFNQNFETEEGVLYNKGKTEIIIYLSASLRSQFIFPLTVTSISGYAFAGATNLESAIITSPIFDSIGYGAFVDCIKLKYFVIPNCTQYIHSMAFSGCNSLACGSVEYPLHLKDQLILSNIPIEALSPCPTILFSAGIKDQSIIHVMCVAGINND